MLEIAGRHDFLRAGLSAGSLLGLSVDVARVTSPKFTLTEGILDLCFLGAGILQGLEPAGRILDANFPVANVVEILPPSPPELPHS